MKSIALLFIAITIQVVISINLVGKANYHHLRLKKPSSFNHRFLKQRNILTWQDVAEGYWGDWSDGSPFKDGFFACGLKLRVLGKVGGWKDETGVQGLEVRICKGHEWKTQDRVVIETGMKGEWGKEALCPEGSFINGFRVKTDGDFGIFGEASGFDGVQISCTKGENLVVSEGRFGSFAFALFCSFNISKQGEWEEARAWSENRICGLQTRYDKGSDSTGLNGLRSQKTPDDKNIYPYFKTKRVLLCSSTDSDGKKIAYDDVSKNNGGDSQGSNINNQHSKKDLLNDEGSSEGKKVSNGDSINNEAGVAKAKQTPDSRDSSDEINKASAKGERTHSDDKTNENMKASGKEGDNSSGGTDKNIVSNAKDQNEGKSDGGIKNSERNSDSSDPQGNRGGTGDSSNNGGKNEHQAKDSNGKNGDGSTVRKNSGVEETSHKTTPNSIDSVQSSEKRGKSGDPGPGGIDPSIEHNKSAGDHPGSGASGLEGDSTKSGDTANSGGAPGGKIGESKKASEDSTQNPGASSENEGNAGGPGKDVGGSSENEKNSGASSEKNNVSTDKAGKEHHSNGTDGEGDINSKSKGSTGDGSGKESNLKGGSGNEANADDPAKQNENKTKILSKLLDHIEKDKPASKENLIDKISRNGESWIKKYLECVFTNCGSIIDERRRVD